MRSLLKSLQTWRGPTNRKHPSSHVMHHLGGIDKGMDRKRLLKSRRGHLALEVCPRMKRQRITLKDR